MTQDPPTGENLPPDRPRRPRTPRLTVHEQRWGPAAHAAAIPAMLVGLGFVGPLLVGRLRGGTSAFVRHNVVQAANFNITVCLAALAAFIWLQATAGSGPPPAAGEIADPQWGPATAISALILLVVYWFLFTVRAMVATSYGEWYRYPPSLRVVR